MLFFTLLCQCYLLELHQFLIKALELQEVQQRLALRLKQSSFSEPVRSCSIFSTQQNNQEICGDYSIQFYAVLIHNVSNGLNIFILEMVLYPSNRALVQCQLVRLCQSCLAMHVIVHHCLHFSSMLATVHEVFQPFLITSCYDYVMWV